MTVDQKITLLKKPVSQSSMNKNISIWKGIFSYRKGSVLEKESL